MDSTEIEREKWFSRNEYLRKWLYTQLWLSDYKVIKIININSVQFVDSELIAGKCQKEALACISLFFFRFASVGVWSFFINLDPA